ncbi:MAG: 50S ribosomal protein L5 [Candidatus Parvarchaeota archaeon]|nr:50S ribosomal protein L5 [Candidatus Parvarchaeota archaeon]
MENKMREIIIAKVTINVGVGEPGPKLEKISKLIEQISGAKTVRTTTKRRIPEWNLRPGLEIGVKTTVRGKRAEDLLKNLLAGVDNKIRESSFDNSGNFSFGVSEYVHIPGAKYDYTVGIIGLSVAVTLERRGFSIAKRRIPAQIGSKHRISKEEAIAFIKNKYNVDIQK